MGFTGDSWGLLGTRGDYWGLLGFTGVWKVFKPGLRPRNFLQRSVTSGTVSKLHRFKSLPQYALKLGFTSLKKPSNEVRGAGGEPPVPATGSVLSELVRSSGFFKENFPLFLTGVTTRGRIAKSASYDRFKCHGRAE